MSNPTRPRKITTKIVIDMNTDAILEEESFVYDGPMALCDGDGGGGGGEPAWSENLPEDVREWDEVKNSDAPEKFWDQMVNMRSRMGSSIRIPSDDAGEEDRAAFYQKLQDKVPGLMATPDFDKEETMADLYSKMGRPKEAKDYQAPEFKNSKGEKIEGAGAKLAESFKEVAFKAGLSQKRYADILSALINPAIGENEKNAGLQAADKAKLAETWGAAHERNSSIVTNFLSQTEAPKSVIDALTAGTVDSTTMVWLHSLATKSLGKGENFQQDNSNTGVMTPDEAALKISEIRNNKEHPYNNRMDPGNASAKKYMRELYLLKNPSSGTNAAPGTQFKIGG